MLFGNCYHGNSCYDNTHVVAKVIVAVVTYNVCDVAFTWIPCLQGLHVFNCFQNLPAA